MSPIKKRLIRAARRSAVGLGLLLMVFSIIRTSEAESYPTIGSSSIIFYNAEREPIRRLANVPLMTSCAVARPDNQAMVYSALNFVTFIDDKGVSRQIQIPAPPREVFGDRDGYIIPVNNGPVLDIDLAGKIVATKAFMALKKAIRHPQGGYVGVTNNGQLLHRKWTDEIVTHITNETAGKTVSFVDIALQDSLTFIALDASTNEVVWLDLALKELKRAPAPIPNASSLSLLSNSMLFVGPDLTSVAILGADGSVKNFKTRSKIRCAGATEDGGFYLGLSSEDSTYIPTDYHADFDAARPGLTYDSLFAIIVYSVIGSMVFVWMWRAISRKALSLLKKGSRSDLQETLTRITEEHPAKREVRSLGLLALLIAIGGLYLSWRVGDQVRTTGSNEAWGLYLLGALIAAVSLLYVARSSGLTSLLPSLSSREQPLGRNRVSWFLLVLAAGLASVAFYLNQDWEYPRVIVIAWIVSQVLALGAFTSSVRAPRLLTSHAFQVLLLCALTAFSRGYKWTECPHDIHFDFGIIAAEAVRNLIDSWNGLFVLCAGQTIGRVWLLQMSASLWAFGLDEWVIRLSSLVWSVGYVLATYLLGRELISHRFGIIAGLLGALQHTLLGYSRLPYVIESTGPFVLCLYFLCRGLRTATYRDWALAGLWAGWSVMTVRTCTTFPFIGGGILLYMCVLHPRVMWRLKWNMVVMGLTAIIAFAPFYNFYMHGQGLTHRLEGMSPLFSNQGIKTDPAIWANQFNAGFGAILRYTDRLSWPMENLAPILLAVTGSLFGCGLILLLTRFRSLATPIILLSIGINITLGSAVLENPPSYYHHFIGTLFVMFVVAVPLEYLFEVARNIRWRIVAGFVTIMVCALTVLATDEVMRPFIRFCQLSVNPDGTIKSRTSLYSVMGLHVLRNRNHRFVAISKGENYFDFHHPTFSIFYGQFSERYDVRSPISSQLPFRPNDKKQTIEFLFLPGHESQLEMVKRYYPTGQLHHLSYAWGSVISYRVDGAEISRAYGEFLRNPSNFDRSFYELMPS